MFREKESQKMSDRSKYVYRHRACDVKQMLICLCNLLSLCYCCIRSDSLHKKMSQSFYKKKTQLHRESVFVFCWGGLGDDMTVKQDMS